jgi:hypothetical protein
MLRLGIGGVAVLLVGHAAPAVAVPRASWTRVPPGSPHPGPRRDHSLTADAQRGRLYLFGGRAGGRSLGDLWEFDPLSGTWLELASDGPTPDPRFGHNAIYDPAGGQLIVALGQAGAEFFQDVWVFRPETGAWTRIGELSPERPAPRYGSAAAFDPAGRRLLVSHGFTDHGRFDDTWAFDITAERWTRVTTVDSLPIKRCLARGAFDSTTGRLLLFGGQTDTSPFLGDLWSLDIAGGKWTELSAEGMPSARHLYGAATSTDGVWHLVGGNTPAGPSGEYWIYEPGLNTWTFGEPPPARMSHDAAILGDTLYIFGGTDGTSELDDLWGSMQEASRLNSIARDAVCNAGRSGETVLPRTT